MRFVEPGEAGRLVVGVTGLALLSILPDDLRRFRRKRPGVDVSVLEVAPERLFDALTAGDVDLVSSYAAPAIDGVTVMPRVDEPLLVAAPERHALAKHRTVAVSALAGERIIMPTRASGHRVHESIRNVLAPVSPREVQQVGMLSTAVGLVAAGLGVAIVPASLAALARRGVCYRPLRPRATLTMSAACREADDSPVLAAFIQSLGRSRVRAVAVRAQGSPYDRERPHRRFSGRLDAFTAHGSGRDLVSRRPVAFDGDLIDRRARNSRCRTIRTNADSRHPTAQGPPHFGPHRACNRPSACEIPRRHEAGSAEAVTKSAR